MTKEEFGRIRKEAGMTFDALGKYLGTTLRSVQRYEYGERSIPGPVVKLMKMLEEQKGKKS